MITKTMAAALGVWLLGFGSAFALAAVLKAPLVERGDKTAPRPAITAVEAVAPVVEPAESVITVPAVTIVARHGRATRHVVVEVKPEVSRDISAMECGEERELSMGSGHVQICE